MEERRNACRYLRAFNHDGEYYLNEVCQFIQGKREEKLQEHISCTILIPVYNGLGHLRRLFPSVIENTPKEVKILVVDDCSPDDEVQEYLRRTVEQNPNWRLIKNKKNLGFTSSVNYGMSLIDTDYAIWLNTDTEVPSNWVERLLYPFSATKNVATTTPFTNSGVLFSFPDYMADNASPRNLEEINEAFGCIVADEFGLNETYSGTGFCMGVNMACWQQIGPLNYEAFGKGYGEENDWCFRALQYGWRHLLVPNLFVSHHHGGSFPSEEKKRLCDEHQGILLRKYPQYAKDIAPRFQKNDPWGIYRKCAALLLSRQNCLLFIDLKAQRNNSVSGAVSYSDYILKKQTEEGYNIIIAQYEQSSRKWELLMYTVDNKAVIQLEDVSDLEMLFAYVNVKKVVINNLAYCENAEKAIYTLIKIKKAYGDTFRLIYKFHDYLSLCPSFFLLNDRVMPCNPKDYNYCYRCIKNNGRKAVDRIAIARWRTQFEQLFAVVDEFDCFSFYSKEIILSVYPQISHRLNVKYHESLLNYNSTKYIKPRVISEFRIAFVGNYAIEKGSHYFQELVSVFKANNISVQFFLLGFNSSGEALYNITDLGRYNRNNLGEKLTESKINLVVYPSINNETFSYVAQELMLLDMPFVVFPCGAPQERIRNSQYEFGAVASEVSVEALCNATLELLIKVLAYNEKLLTENMRQELKRLKSLKLTVLCPKTEKITETICAPSMEKIHKKSVLNSYFMITQTPPYGVKEAIKIWLNKRCRFIFKNIADEIPPEIRCFGIKDTLKIWIIKQMLK